MILDRLVTLHDARVEEEKAGTVRWLRPEYQKARFGKQTAEELELPGTGDAAAAPVSRVPWPGNAIGQITALRALAATRPITVDEAADHFEGARRDIVARHLETLAILGEVQRVGDGYCVSV